MVKKCQICFKVDKYNPNLYYFRFPKDEGLKRDWLLLLGLSEDKFLPQIPFICSNHFREDDITIKIIKCLKPNALPIPAESDVMGSSQKKIISEDQFQFKHCKPPLDSITIKTEQDETMDTHLFEDKIDSGSHNVCDISSEEDNKQCWPSSDYIKCEELDLKTEDTENEQDSMPLNDCEREKDEEISELSEEKEEATCLNFKEDSAAVELNNVVNVVSNAEPAANITRDESDPKNTQQVKFVDAENIEQSSGTKNDTNLEEMMASTRHASRRAWDKQAMKNAIIAIRENKMGYLKASKIFKVPRSTLLRLSKNKDLSLDSVTNIKLGRKATLPAYLENDLVDSILEMENRGFSFSSQDIKSLAYQLATQNNLSNTFSTENGSAGKTWLKLFLARHPHLTVSRLTGTSKIKVLNKERISAFFYLLEQEMKEFKYPPDNIYSVGEVDISIGSLKGKKQTVKPTEMHGTIACVVCMSAAGSFVPPMMIFSRKQNDLLLMNGAPPGAIHACHPTGRIQTHSFTQWFKHFLERVNPSAASPVLLILDGHKSYTRNIDFINLARDNNVRLLSVPPHSNDKMLPIAKAFFGPLKKYLNKSFVRAKAITDNNIAALFGRAYVKAQRVDIAIEGFRDAGIYPLNRHIFRDYDFNKDCTNNASSDQYINKTDDETISPHLLPGPSRVPAFTSSDKNNL